MPVVVAALNKWPSSIRSLLKPKKVEQMEFQDFIAQGDKVLVFGHYKGRVKSTGRSYTKDFIHVVTLRDNKVIKFREYVASDDMYDAFAGK